MKTKLMLILLSMSMIACAPMSKEAYMERYANFILEISQNASSYTESDWMKNDETFNKYSEVYFQKFQKELTASDKMTLAKYKAKYYYYKCLGKAELKAGEVLGTVAGQAEPYLNELLDALNETSDESGNQDNLLDSISDKMFAIIDQFGSDNK